MNLIGGEVEGLQLFGGHAQAVVAWRDEIKQEKSVVCGLNFTHHFAAAYAEAGQFDDAIREQWLSIEGVNKEGKDPTEYELHLKSYLSQKPWHE